jgi:hypothetical protein
MATARVGHHSNSPFALHSVPCRSTHSVDGSNRHPPEAVSKTTTEHFGQATGAINECLLAREGSPPAGAVGCTDWPILERIWGRSRQLARSAVETSARPRDDRGASSAEMAKSGSIELEPLPTTYQPRQLASYATPRRCSGFNFRPAIVLCAAHPM